MVNKTVKGVVLCRTTLCEIDIPINLDINNFDENKLTYKLKRGKGEIERHCDWEIEDNITISIFGWKDGIAGTENKNELPPPEDDSGIFFGDILVIKSKKNEVLNLTTDEYTEFVETAYGGFEDLNSDDSDNSDDESLDEYEKNSWLASSDEEDDDYLLDEDDDEEDDEEDEDMGADDDAEDTFIGNTKRHKHENEEDGHTVIRSHTKKSHKSVHK